MDIHEEIKQYKGLTFQGYYNKEIQLSYFHDLTIQEKHDIYALSCEAMKERELSLIEMFSKIFIAGRISGIRQERGKA